MLIIMLIIEPGGKVLIACRPVFYVLLMTNGDLMEYDI